MIQKASDKGNLLVQIGNINPVRGIERRIDIRPGILCTDKGYTLTAGQHENFAVQRHFPRHIVSPVLPGNRVYTVAKTPLGVEIQYLPYPLTGFTHATGNIREFALDILSHIIKITLIENSNCLGMTAQIQPSAEIDLWRIGYLECKTFGEADINKYSKRDGGNKCNCGDNLEIVS